MKKNMGTADRVIRVILAALVVVLYLSGLVGGVFGIVLLAVAGVLALTSLAGFCPLYAPFGIRTCGPKQKQVAR